MLDESLTMTAELWGEVSGRVASSAGTAAHVRSAGATRSRARRVCREPLLSLPDAGGPIYQRLYRELRRQITTGNLAAGSRLPSSRLLAQDLGVSRNTASLALEQLVAEGWAESASRRGVFVAAHPTRLRRQDTASLLSSGSSPDLFDELLTAKDLFPTAMWQLHLKRCWREASVGELMSLDEGLGHPRLRLQLAQVVLASRSICVPESRVAVFAGSQVALPIVAHTLAGESGSIALESVSCPKLAEAISIRGTRTVPVQLDSQGMIVDDLAQLPSGSVAVVSAGRHRFTGGALSPLRRVQLLEWAEANHGWVIEMEETSALPTSRLLPLSAEYDHPRLLYMRDLGRTLFPGLNLSVLAFPANLVDRLSDLREIEHGRLGNHDQIVLASFIRSGGFAAHQRRRSLTLARRRKAAIALFQHSRLSVTAMELEEFIKLHGNDRDVEVVVRMINFSGLACRPLSYFSLSHQSASGILIPVMGFSQRHVEQLGANCAERSV